MDETLDSPIISELRENDARSTQFCTNCRLSLGLVEIVEQCEECGRWYCGDCGADCFCDFEFDDD